jgi:hypothetical protein
MKRLAGVCSCLLLVGFAPAPVKKVEGDPDKAIEQFDREFKGKTGAFVEARKKELLGRLKKLQADLEKKGKADQANAVRERLLLAQTLTEDHPLGKASSRAILTKAGAGRYKRLTRVLLLPSDQANYNQFTDFGFWQGTAYGGAADLSPGYWVYVYPRWFIWRDGPPRP